MGIKTAEERWSGDVGSCCSLAPKLGLSNRLRAEKDATKEGCGHWMKSMEIIPESTRPSTHWNHPATQEVSLRQPGRFSGVLYPARLP